MEKDEIKKHIVMEYTLSVDVRFKTHNAPMILNHFAVLDLKQKKNSKSDKVGVWKRSCCPTNTINYTEFHKYQSEFSQRQRGTN